MPSIAKGKETNTGGSYASSTSASPSSSGKNNSPYLSAGWTMSAALTGAACFECGDLESAIKKCSGCQCVGFCSPRCEKQAWKEGGHRESCKTMACINRSLHAKGKEIIDWRFRTNEVNMALEKKVDCRMIKGIDRGVIILQPHCSTCNDVERPGNPLKSCDRCHWDYLCRSHLQNRHNREECDTYLKVNRTQYFQYQEKRKRKGEPFIWAPSSTHFNYYRDVLPEGWEKYFKWRIPKDELKVQREEFLTAATKLLSQPLSTLMAIEHYGLGEETSLLIHVAGASSYEVPASFVWEEILHVRPRLQHLKVVFIGPDLSEMTEPEMHAVPHEEKAVCKDCKAKTRKMAFGYFAAPYEEYNARPDSEKPDLVMMFNSGIHADINGGPWLPALKCLLRLHVPICLTSYNSTESEEDAKTFEKYGGEVTMGPMPNPFCCQEPKIDFNDTPLFYHQNEHITCAQGVPT
eukprot:Nk52_evm127s226 gene=Nk52_evmTU127s226